MLLNPCIGVLESNALFLAISITLTALAIPTIHSFIPLFKILLSVFCLAVTVADSWVILINKMILSLLS